MTVRPTWPAARRPHDAEAAVLALLTVLTATVSTVLVAALAGPAGASQPGAEERASETVSRSYSSYRYAPDSGDESVVQYGARDERARTATRFNLTTDGFAFSWNQQDSVVEPGSVKICTSVAAYFRLQDTEGDQRETAIKKVGFPDACLST